ncbi:PREDICTED: WD repeat-containing and planar cell polarity effector protein fritz [Papilio polytes]|uniref:WD repeat-containing and planar cell polarity effector protein fritz n=1 Tax=Papilio polytes TaxID=76194 RepID=UPI000675FCB1|nr:PREDICTED: WD repeat-containing and planar cell polarity effector protein fritz [Papilio polytes]
MFSYNVKFITSEETLFLKSGDFKSFKYETRKRLDENIYDAGKRSYCERRGGYWRIPKSSQLRQLESTLKDRNIVECIWVNDLLATLVFSSGAIAYISINPETLDVTQILFDRYCVGKLSGQTVTGVAFSKTHLLFTHAERTATLLTFGKSIEDSSHPCRLSDRDPHIQVLELGGARGAERRVSWCCDGSGMKVLLWSAASAEPAPWSPVLEDLANLHLYYINGQQVSLIAFHQLENEVLCAELSQKNDNVVHIVEQTACNKVNILHDLEKKIVCKYFFLKSDCETFQIPTDVRWAGELVVAVEEAGRLQCFDRALSLLHHHTKCLDLVSHFRDTRGMQVIATRDMKTGPLILALFAGGPLTLLHITHPRLLTAWMRADRTSNAISLLRAMDWEEEGVDSQPTILPVPITQNEPTSTHSIRPNLHQYLERDNTIWNTELRDDTCLDRKMYEEQFKPIKNQTVKWQSVDTLMNYRKPISNSDIQRSHIFDAIPRVQDDKIHFKHVYQTDLREAIPTTYRYQSNISTNANGRLYRHDSTWSGKPLEKNKVKFSDTVTVAVVSEPPSSPDTAHELADSLPLCAPHKYLAAFAPAPVVPKPPPKLPTNKLTISKVPTIAKSIATSPISPSPTQSPAENPVPQPPKIKVVHFGMV